MKKHVLLMLLSVVPLSALGWIVGLSIGSAIKRVFAQAPAASITVTSTVTAVAGPVTCTFSAPSKPAFTASCSNAGTVFLTANGTPAAANTAGVVVSGVVSGNNVTAIFTQGLAGTNVLNWSVTASPSGGTAVSQSGTF